MSEKVQGIIQFIFVVLFIVGSFVISAGLQASKKEPDNTKREERLLLVDAKEIKGAPYRIEFKTTGVVQARADIQITPQVSGRVTDIDEAFFTGGSFEANKTLFQIDIRDYELEIERLQAEVARAKTQLEIEEVEAEAAIKEWRQINGKKKQPPALVAREPQLKEAKANYNGAQAQLANAKLDLERASFSYPFAGRVIDSNLEIGQHVSAGQNYGTVYNLEALEIETSLDDKQLEWLLSADDIDVKIMSDFLGETKTHEGILRRGTSSLDSQTRFADISFGFADNAHGLLPGVFVDVVIRGATLTDIGVIPASALQTDGSVWILKDDNTLDVLKPDILYSTENTIALNNFGSAKNVVVSRVSGATKGMKAQQIEN